MLPGYTSVIFTLGEFRIRAIFIFVALYAGIAFAYRKIWIRTINISFATDAFALFCTNRFSGTAMVVGEAFDALDAFSVTKWL